MASSDSSYAEPLRAIGQALEALHVEAFVLESAGGDFLVRTQSDKTSAEAISQKSFLKNLVQQIWDDVPPELEQSLSSMPAQRLRYTTADIEQLKKAGRAKRRTPDGTPEASKLSQALRAIGDYLNQKRAADFVIYWDSQSVSITCRTAENKRENESFRVGALYDLGLRMHRRRSPRDH